MPVLWSTGPVLDPPRDICLGKHFYCQEHQALTAFPMYRRIDDKRLDINFRYAYHTYMRTFWNPRKAKSNLGKHGIRFSDAEIVFFDPAAITREDTSARN